MARPSPVELQRTVLSVKKKRETKGVRGFLLMEWAGSSGTLASLYQTTWCHITEDQNLNTHSHEDIKCHSCLRLLCAVVTSAILFQSANFPKT